MRFLLKAMDFIRLENNSATLMRNVWFLIMLIVILIIPYKENISVLKLGIITYLHLQRNTCLIIKPPTMPDKMLHEILFLLSTTCHVFRGIIFCVSTQKGSIKETRQHAPYIHYDKHQR